jgi:hypothetical protein
MGREAEENQMESCLDPGDEGLFPEDEAMVG